MRAAINFIGRLFGQPSQQAQDDFRAGLQAWVESALPEERGGRAEAMRRMIEARQNRSSELSLGGLGLSSIPEQIGNLTALTSLDLGGNQLTTLPERIGNLTALTSLDLYNNRLTTLPERIGNLTALTYLRLSHNRLTTLPEQIGDLTALEDLYLSNNQLITLPEGIGDLTALEDLYLSNNQLITLPEGIGNLTALTYLSLFHNPLTPSPTLLDRLSELETRGCDISYPDEITSEVRDNRAEWRLQQSRLQQVSRTLALASYDPKSHLSQLEYGVIMAEVLKFTTDTRLLPDDTRLLSEEEKKEVFEATEKGLKETDMYKRYVKANSTADNQELETKSVTASPAEVIASKETEERSYKSDYEDSRSSEERSSSHQASHQSSHQGAADQESANAPSSTARDPLAEIALAREVFLGLGDSGARTEPRATTTPAGGVPFVGGGSLEQGSPRSS